MSTLPARPHDAVALAAAVVSSVILAHDPVARAVAPDYWDWSAEAHHRTADAVLALPDLPVAAAAERLAKDPADDGSAAELADLLGSLFGGAAGAAGAARTHGPVAALAETAAETETLSRLLAKPGRAGVPAAGAVPGAAELLAGLPRPPHRGRHPVDAAVVIPYRAADDAEGRVRNLAAVLAALADQSHPRERYRVVVVESDARPRWRELVEGVCDTYLFAPDPGRFNKSWTVNVGVVHGARPAELVCVLDGDILVDRDFVARAVERFREPGTQGHWPYRDMLFLDPQASVRAVRARCIDGQGAVDQSVHRGVHLRRPPGGCVWLRESFFSRIGGMDERFSGWGGEDQDFVWRAERYGPMDRHADPIVHLHHDRAPHRAEDGVPFYEEVEQAGFCSWPCDSVIGQLDRHVPAS
ncbi:glycosyltransferase [Kitasatospora sp. McL0602]|uniref:glycosyltransferase n=1 Tax=Kitasatospora sp. McL0602 TaxID=3439530 RepID=UPI003F8C54AE